MKGKVVRYFEDKGYGFITDEKDNNRFFHISDIKSTSPILLYCDVEFLPSTSQKGLVAKDVFVTNNSRPLFASFGDVRIKLSNVKSYGLTSETETREEEIILKKARLKKL